MWKAIAVTMLATSLLAVVLVCGGCAATMVLEDMHTAAWMPLERGDFVSIGTQGVCALTPNPTDDQKFGACAGNYSPADDHRPGVLLQIGVVHRLAGDNNYFDRVTIRRSAGTPIELQPQTFDWLDVNAVGLPCVIDAVQAYGMFHTDVDPNPPIQEVVETDCDEEDFAAVALPDSLKKCLRNRQIQAGFLPNKGIITYWPGSKSYSVKMERVPESDPQHRDFAYVFSLRDKVTVDHWLNGCWLERYEDVTEIRIRYKSSGSAHHQGFPHPPMDGGTFGPPE